MSGENPNWISAIEHLSRPATLLVEKISGAIGMLYQPRHVKQMAQAEADAALITAKGEIAVDDLHRRALIRWVHEEAQKQSNIEAITERAIPLLEHEAEPDKIDDDWLRLLFDKARHVSNPEMQELWAKLLAREANNRDAVSIHAVNTLALMDRRDAGMLARACQLVPNIGNKPHMVVMERDNGFCIEGGSTLTELRRLEEIGILRISSRPAFHATDLPDPFTIDYGGRRGVMKFTQHNHRNAITGEAAFTSIGWQLFHAIPVPPSPHVWDYLRERWTKQSHLEIVSWDNWQS